MLAACQAAGVSVRTGYRWLARFRAEGAPGLEDRPSISHRRPHANSPERVRAIITLRGLRMTGLQIAQALGMAHSTVSGSLPESASAGWCSPSPPGR